MRLVSLCVMSLMLPACSEATSSPAGSGADVDAGAQDGGGADVRPPDASPPPLPDASMDASLDGPPTEAGRECASAESIHARLVGRTLSWEDINYSTSLSAAFPFRRVDYIAGTPGHFIASGDCTFTGGGAEFEAGGLVLLDASGGYLGQRNVCFDTSDRAKGCQEAGGCAAGAEVHRVGASRFVREAYRVPGKERSPVLYRVEQDRVELEGLAFFNDFNLPDGQSRPLEAAVAGGYLWASARGDAVTLEKRQLTADLETVEVVPSTDRPIIGVGPLLLTRASTPVNPFINVRNAQQAGAPVLEQIDGHGRIFGAAFADPAHPDQIAIKWAGADDVVEVLRRAGDRMERVSSVTTADPEAIAIMGDYLLYQVCPGGACAPVLTRAGAPVTMDPLPDSGEPGYPYLMIAAAIGPNGTILVALDNTGINGELWVYQLDDPDPTCRAE